MCDPVIWYHHSPDVTRKQKKIVDFKTRIRLAVGGVVLAEKWNIDDYNCVRSFCIWNECSAFICAQLVSFAQSILPYFHQNSVNEMQRLLVHCAPRFTAARRPHLSLRGAHDVSRLMDSYSKHDYSDGPSLIMSIYIWNEIWKRRKERRALQTDTGSRHRAFARDAWCSCSKS